MNDNTQLAQRNEGTVTRREEKSSRRVTLVPAVDIVEDADGVTLWADLPGVSRDNLQISFNDGALHIKGQAVVPTPSELRVQHAELRQPHFARSFSLSSDLDAGKIAAQLHDGVLKLTIPRREEAKPRRITINSA